MGTVLDLLNVQQKSQRAAQWKAVPDRFLQYLFTSPNKAKALQDLEKLLVHAETRAAEITGELNREIEAHTHTEREFHAQQTEAFRKHAEFTKAAEKALEEAQAARAGANTARSLRSNAKGKLRAEREKVENFRKAVSHAKQLFAQQDIGDLAGDFGIEVRK